MADNFTMIRAAPVFWVRDIQDMITFYEQKLGFSDVWKEGDQDSPVYAIVSRDGVQIHFAPQKPQLAGHSYIHVLMSNVDNYWEFIRSRKVEIVKDIGDRDYNMRDFMIRDIEGNFIEFGESL